MTKALQRKIFVGCRELGLDNAARKDLQLVVTGKESLSDMNEAELLAVIDRLKADGFKPSSKGKPKKLAPAPRADLRLVHVLWATLGNAGELERPGRDGLNAFIRSRFEATWSSVPLDVDMLRDWHQIDAVINALRDWIERKGIPFDWNRVQR